MSLRDRMRVATDPYRAQVELDRWRDRNRDHRAPEPGEVTEYDPKTKRYVPVQR